jgi:hypothetical protein
MTSSISETEVVEAKVKTCATCKHLRGNRSYPQEFEKWECFKSAKTINIISGVISYANCRDLRFSKNSCDIDGKWYEEYIKPIYAETPFSGAQMTEIVFDEDALKANREAAQKAIAERKAAKGLSNIKLEEL